MSLGGGTLQLSVVMLLHSSSKLISLFDAFLFAENKKNISLHRKFGETEG